MLWVALELPALPLQLVERAQAAPLPLVIGEGPALRPVVACANAAARALGAREGMAVAAARAPGGRVGPKGGWRWGARAAARGAWAG